MLYARRSRTHPPFRECEYNNDLLRAALVTLRSDVALDMGAAWHWRKEQGPGGSGFANSRAAVRVAQPGDPSRRRRTCWIAPRFCISGISSGAKRTENVLSSASMSSMCPNESHRRIVSGDHVTESNDAETPKTRENTE